MYYGMLARFSAVVDTWSGRLLRRSVVIPTAVLFLVALPLGGVLRWISGMATVALFLLFLLWLARNFARRKHGPGAGLP